MDGSDYLLEPARGPRHDPVLGQALSKPTHADHPALVSCRPTATRAPISVSATRSVAKAAACSTPTAANGRQPSATSGRSLARPSSSGSPARCLPTSSWCEDGWVMAAALSQVTERFKFLVAYRPGLVSPLLAAQMAATFQRVSGGRLLLNVVTGGDDVEQARFGDHLSKPERYARAAEYLASAPRAVDRGAGRLLGRARRRPWSAADPRRRSGRTSTSAAPRPPRSTSRPSMPTST